MVGSNLPDDVSPSDIDKAFSPPKESEKHGTVYVEAVVEKGLDNILDVVNVNITGDGEVVHTETIEELGGEVIYLIHVGVTVKNSLTDIHEIERELRNLVNVSVDESVVSYQIIDSEVHI